MDLLDKAGMINMDERLALKSLLIETTDIANADQEWNGWSVGSAAQAARSPIIKSALERLELAIRN